jgi:hypothetical protein
MVTLVLQVEDRLDIAAENYLFTDFKRVNQI